MEREARWHNKIFELYPTGDTHPSFPIKKGEEKRIGAVGSAGKGAWVTSRLGDKNTHWRFYPLAAEAADGTDGMFVIAHVATGCVLTRFPYADLHSFHGANNHLGLRAFSEVEDKSACAWQLRFPTTADAETGDIKARIERIQNGQEVCHIVSSTNPNHELVVFHYGVDGSLSGFLLEHHFAGPGPGGNFTRGFLLARTPDLESKECAWDKLKRFEGRIPRPALTKTGGLPTKKALEAKAVVLGEMWLPYFRVEDSLSDAERMKKSPYYKLSREIHFAIDTQLQNDLYWDNLAGGAPEIIKIGLSETSSTTLTDAVSKTVGASVSVSASSGVAGIADVEVTATASWEMGTSHEEQLAEGKGGTLDEEHTIQAGTSMGLFRRISTIALRRLDGTKVRAQQVRGTRVKAEFRSKKLHIAGGWAASQPGWAEQAIKLTQSSATPDGDGWRAFTASFDQKSDDGKSDRHVDVIGKYKGASVTATWIVGDDVKRDIQGYLLAEGTRLRWPSEDSMWTREEE